MDRTARYRALSVRKECRAVEKKEQKMERAAHSAGTAAWKKELEDRIPPKVYTGLESAFCKAFALVFDKGRIIIEKSYDKESIRADYQIKDYAVQVKGRRKELKQLQKSARKADLFNMAITTAEGIGLGALGVGIPDVALFLGTLLKGIYETALHYGFEYESRQEQFLILKMMAASLSTGDDWDHRNREVDQMLALETLGITEEAFQEQMQETASLFAMDMLLLKFIQGIPLVGALGGAANPVYYGKVMKYVQLKYRKRYLLKQM